MVLILLIFPQTLRHTHPTILVMKPRLAAGGIPVGLARRKRSTKMTPLTKTSKSLPPVLQLCHCYECVACPGPHPVTGLPSTGRFLAPYELKLHRRRDRQRGTAALMLGTSLQAPELELPTPATLFTLTSPPVRPNPTPDTPFPFRTSSPLFASRSAPSTQIRTKRAKPQSAAQLAALSQELEDLVRLIKPAAEVIGNEPLAFKNPPDPFSPAASELSSESMDGLFALDPVVQKNSSIFGHHQLLLRILKCAEDNVTTTNTSFRLRCQLARCRADEELTALRKLKLEQWERQRLVAVPNHTVIDTGQFFYVSCHSKVVVVHIFFSFYAAIHYVQPCFFIEPITLACYLLVATLHLVCHVSIDHCKFVSEVLRVIVELALSSSSTMAPKSHNIVGGIYTDVRTIVNVLDLKCYSTAYVCCPRCFAIYWIDPDNPKAYPEICTKQETDHEHFSHP